MKLIHTMEFFQWQDSKIHTSKAHISIAPVLRVHHEEHVGEPGAKVGTISVVVPE